MHVMRMERNDRTDRVAWQGGQANQHYLSSHIMFKRTRAKKLNVFTRRQLTNPHLTGRLVPQPDHRRCFQNP